MPITGKLSAAVKNAKPKDKPYKLSDGQNPSNINEYMPGFIEGDRLNSQPPGRSSSKSIRSLEKDIESALQFDITSLQEQSHYQDNGGTL